MKCPRCQHENPPQAKFCLECGARVGLTCTKCASELPAGAKFCLECGQPVASQTTTEPRFTSPESYTPKHLAEKILTSKTALEGERKQVTVLFADLKGSMELLADRDPEEARKILDPVLERMMEAVHHYEGTVNQVMGDGIMALFGAPLAHEDHAVRACYAALRMQESVAQYAERVFRSHGVPIQIRVGLNSGEVVVRAIGSDLHMDYTAVGQTTHLAARMEQMAMPGTILLAPATLQLAEGYVQVGARGPVAVKGLPGPVEIYALTGVSALRSRLHATAARGLTRFVGRDAEIELLRRALTHAEAGHGQLVAIVGEPGVGKSRLVHEFTHSHRTQNWLIVEAGSVSYGRATSYLPVIDLLKAYFKVQDRDTHREVREKLTGKLLTLDRALEPTLPAFLALLDVPVEDAQWQALDPAQRRQHTLDAVKHLLLRESQGHPLLVVFEDLHWVDAETQALLDGLVESLPTARLLLLVNYRPEYQHGWGRKTYYSQLRLDALPPESAGELLSALLGDNPGLEPLKRLLVRRGNPFFIEESIRMLVETGALTGERGAHRLTRSIQAIEVPATVQVILAARIDRLPADDKQLLQMAAVIGKDVPLVLLHAVADAAEDAVQRGLTHLQAAELLYETHLFPDAEYTFKHALTHEVTYGTLLQDRRKTLHARIVGAIERSYPDRLTEHVERLAHHALRGEAWDKALDYFRQAGQKAASRSAHREALRCFEQAREALDHLPESREPLVVGIDLRLDLRDSLLALGEVERGGGLLEEARALAEALDDRPRLSRILSSSSNYFRISGDPHRALESGRRALAIAEMLQDVSLKVYASYELAMVWAGLGEYRKAADAQRTIIDSIEGDKLVKQGAAIPSVHLRTWLAINLATLGEFREAIVRAEEALGIAEAARNDFSLMHACLAVGAVHARQGTPEKAIPSLERSAQIGESRGLGLIMLTIAAALGSAYVLSGRFSEAVTLLEQARDRTAGRTFAGHALLLAQLGEAYLPLGRIDEADEAARLACELARTRSERGFEAWAMRLMGEIHARQDPPNVDRAEAAYAEAMARAEELGMRPLVSHCHLGLGKLYARTGKRQEAQEHLTTSATMYREMDMRFWLDKAEEEGA